MLLLGANEGQFMSLNNNVYLVIVSLKTHDVFSCDTEAYRVCPRTESPWTAKLLDFVFLHC